MPGHTLLADDHGSLLQLLPEHRLGTLIDRASKSFNAPSPGSLHRFSCELKSGIFGQLELEGR